jgi:hypothetical protein
MACINVYYLGATERAPVAVAVQGPDAPVPGAVTDSGSWLIGHIRRDHLSAGNVDRIKEGRVIQLQFEAGNRGIVVDRGPRECRAGAVGPFSVSGSLKNRSIWQKVVWYVH